MPSDSFIQRRPRLTLALVVGGFCLFLLVLVEIGLRLADYAPGMLDINRRFLPQDTLILEKHFIVDSLGIFHVSPESRDTVNRRTYRIADYSLRGVYDAFTNFDTAQSNFGAFVRSTRRKPTPDAVDSLYLHYFANPVNADGFRSIPFQFVQTKKKKVLLIGDSFTWGLDAKPITNSFADQLSAMGFVVYNAGIPSADPAQYAAIAKQYIAKLKPDAVVVNFCMANDLMYAPRRVKPFAYAHYPTNAGWINGAPRGDYLDDYRQAYRYIQDWHYIPNQKNNSFNWFCAQTSVTSRLWKMLANNGLVEPFSPEFKSYYQKTAPLLSKTSVSEQYLITIDSATQANGARFLLAVLPEPDAIDSTKIAAAMGLKQLSFAYPNGLTKSDYEGSHFNNAGAKKYALFLANELARK